MARWECIVCGLIYDEKEGWPEDGIAPGTKWEDVPDDWTCPDCGVGKDDFELIPGSDEGDASSNEAEAPSTPKSLAFCSNKFNSCFILFSILFKSLIPL